MRMPDDMERKLVEWAARQRESSVPIEKPKDLREYLEKRRHIIEKAAENGCMIG